MHCLVNRSIMCFLERFHGPDLSAAAAAEAGLGPEGLEPMGHIDDAFTYAVLDAAGRRLGRTRDSLLEDLGIYLAGIEPLRRLLRFGGASFDDFLLSIDELPDRVRLAVPDLDLPDIALDATGPGRFELDCGTACPGFAAVLAGVLRAMADDYGTLALIDADGGPGRETVAIELLDACFTPGRDFDLARPEPR